MNIRTLFNLLTYGSHCLICKTPADTRFNICVSCYLAIRLPQEGCTVCGQVLPKADTVCGRCIAHPRAFNRLLSATEFTPVVKPLIYRLKTYPDHSVVRLVATMIAKRMKSQRDKPDALVPVPLYLNREIKRGYNQSHLLAKAIGRYTHIPVLNLLKQTRPTVQQKQFNRKNREKNVRNAFALKTRPTEPLPQHVVLIDDVATTTATMHQCAGVLKKAGVQTIDAWTFSRVM